MTQRERPEIIDEVDVYDDMAELTIARPVSIYVKVGIVISLIATLLISFGMGRFPISPSEPLLQRFCA